MKKILLLLGTHALVGGFGFALGIYTLPILIQPEAPSETDIAQMASAASYTAEFSRAREDSDALHWGEGEVSISVQRIALSGRLAPGPNYKLYLAKEFVETESKFNALKSGMALVGDVRTFDNFLVSVPAHIDPAQYNTVIVWCESFGEFITSAQYR